MATQEPNHTPYTVPGMPALDISGKQLSFFEFWPTWLMYLPVVVQSIVLAARFRSLTLPLIANPELPLSGMVGVGKSQLLEQAQGHCKQAILPWFRHQISDQTIDDQVQHIESAMVDHNLAYPVVCKPDVGCRGSGVRLIQDPDALSDALGHYPLGAGVLIQKLSSWEPEAGVFYVREPRHSEGRIVSLALKYSPHVVGNGVNTLGELIADDPRARELQHLYLNRHRAMLDTVIEEGIPYRLVFSASHCRGAIFRDANHMVTTQLTETIDRMMRDLPEFHYGRLDIKFRDIDSLSRGESIEIVEINSASSESLHIWDRNTRLRDALSTLLFQYRTLYQLGAQNRARGYKPPALKTFLHAWSKERKLTRYYPETD